MKVLVTGGAGFIGSNFIKWLHNNDKSVHITNLDALTYAGNLENLNDVSASNRYKFVQGNICDSTLTDDLISKNELVINFAAETHVDKSLLDAKEFIKTNVQGTLNLLESVKKKSVKTRFVQISTDEVYGSIETGKFTEDSSIHPNNPYAESKAKADEHVQSYIKKYNLDALTVRSSNNYGPAQFPEKLIPLVITRSLKNEQIPIFGDGLHVRDWIFTEDFARGIWLATTKANAGSIYNFGNEELKNIDVVKRILKALDKPESLIKYVLDRKNHDLRYSMNWSKAHKDLGWSPKVPFESGLQITIDWYRHNYTSQN